MQIRGSIDRVDHYQGQDWLLLAIIGRLVRGKNLPGQRGGLLVETALYLSQLLGGVYSFADDRSLDLLLLGGGGSDPVGGSQITIIIDCQISEARSYNLNGDNISGFKRLYPLGNTY